jgi:hypothetical protein
MEAWKTLWTVGLLVAGSAFALTTLVVIFKGAKDLRAMFRALRAGPRDPRP